MLICLELCLKHTNQRSGSEAEATVFLSVHPRQEEEKPSSEDSKKDEPVFLSNTMLRKSQRVPKDLFPSTKTQKQLVSSLLFSISYSKSSEKARISCVVSKKVSPSAVKRNLVRRRIYEAIRPVLTAESSGTVVVYAKKPVILSKFKDLLEDLTSALSKTSFVFDKGPRP